MKETWARKSILSNLSDLLLVAAASRSPVKGLLNSIRGDVKLLLCLTAHVVLNERVCHVVLALPLAL